MAGHFRISKSRQAISQRLIFALAACLIVLAVPAACRAADGNSSLQFFYLHDNPPKIARAQNGTTCPEKGGEASDKSKEEDCGKGNDTSDDKGAKDKDDDEKKIHYGPDACKPRKTLMQWSYGTTFSGGPPGMDEPLESDRPDFTESPLTVGKGVVQLETGYDYFLDHHAGDVQTTHSFPDTLWRIGMFADWFEWRIEYNYEIVDDRISNGSSPPTRLHASGSDDLRLGFKLCLTPQEGILPAMGIIPAINVPSGSPSMTEGAVMPSFIWAYNWELNKTFQLGGSTDLERRRDAAGNIFLDFDQSLSLQTKLAEHLHMYTEWFFIVPNGQTIERTQQYADGGFVYDLTNNVQLDIEAGLGLNEAADDFFVGTGAVLRF